MSEIAQRTKTRGSGQFQSQRQPSNQLTPLFDAIARNFLGQQATVPNIPISTPLQQAISGSQDIMQPLFNQVFGPQATGGLASRLASPGMTGSSPVPQFGRTQTREELGLPERREYFPFAPTVEQIETIGVPPIRQAVQTGRQQKKVRKLEKRETRLEGRVARRGQKGLKTKGAEKRLSRVRNKLERKRASVA